ncbi:hypothetical protein PUN28_016514 [Cardiocondyla obscurior]|uniref:Uncharacterized protein n=1 Tax=Cardiocondyla obscurior TaxID=286306 RepID=A0AAW2EP45_9HYME
MHSGLQYGGEPKNPFRQEHDGASPTTLHSAFAPQGDVFITHSGRQPTESRLTKTHRVSVLLVSFNGFTINSVIVEYCAVRCRLFRRRNLDWLDRLDPVAHFSRKVDHNAVVERLLKILIKSNYTIERKLLTSCIHALHMYTE